jgi:hypothetical protein|tara:strand:+ start:470 stop:682 length:213 start_codon:yes stop_codon:yes gene_type:complete
MMSACSRLTALPAQFARGRTASLTSRTAKFTAQVKTLYAFSLATFPRDRENFPRHRCPPPRGSQLAVNRK